MNKQTMWTDDELDYFAHLYRNHECLWNVIKGSFSSNPIRKAAVEVIAAEMKKKKGIDCLGVEEVTEKIYLLRSRYYQLRMLNDLSTTAPSEPKRKWYEDMDYIVKNSEQNKRWKDTYPLDSKQGDPSAMPQSSIKLKSRIAIMNVLKKLYTEKFSTNFNDVFDVLNKVALIQSNDSHLTADIPSFIHEMTKLGYNLEETIGGKKVIIENGEQRFERYIYLNKMGKLRANNTKPIVYIGERVINLELKYEKLNLSYGLPPQSSLFFHAITNNGFVNGLFSNQATEEDFNKWITDVLLGFLKKPSIIVMDKNPIHGVNIDTCAITRYSTKTEMIEWLIANNVPCNYNISRPELFELIQMNRRETKEYKIDKIITSYGHEVLRLPDGFPELNMNDIFWNAISEGNSTMIKFKTLAISSLQVLQNSLIDIMLPSITAAKWYDLENTLIMNEYIIHLIDIEIENIIENYEFM